MYRCYLRCWVHSFKSSEKDNGDRARSDRPATATMTKTKGKTDGQIEDYWHNTSELCAAIRIGKVVGMTNISELGYRTVCVR